MTDADKWLRRYAPVPDPRLRLFCFPYAGGAASAFRSWSHELPAGVELIAIQPPGRETRHTEAALTRLAPVVDGVVRALCWQLDRPFVFFGHSLGSIVAFETARATRERYGVSPVHLVASGHRPPQAPPDAPLVFNRPTEAFIAAIRELNGTPDEVLRDHSVLEMYLPVLRADFEIDETYEYQPGTRVSCPITVFAGDADPWVDPAGLGGWADVTEGACSLSMFGGDHFFLDGARPALLGRLSALLDGAMAADGDEARGRSPGPEARHAPTRRQSPTHRQ